MPDATGLVGQTISHYRISETLGDGGMGAVYQAENSTLGGCDHYPFLGW